MMKQEIQETEKIKIHCCSRCRQPTNVSSSSCNGIQCNQNLIREFNVPKVSGRYFTHYFDDEWKGIEGKTIRSAQVKEWFSRFIIKGEQYKITQLFESLEQIFTVYREDQPHNAECEFALGTSCSCWCGEKYHGLRGEGAERKRQK